LERGALGKKKTLGKRKKKLFVLGVGAGNFCYGREAGKVGLGEERRNGGGVRGKPQLRGSAVFGVLFLQGRGVVKGAKRVPQKG